MKKNKYKVLTKEGKELDSFECETLVINDGVIVAFNTTKTEPKSQDVIFATRSNDVLVIKIA